MVEAKSCEVCLSNQHKNKCPCCLTKYCSVACFKVHKDSNICKSKSVQAGSNSKVLQNVDIDEERDSEDVVPKQVLERLGTNKHLRDLLVNPHLRDILLEVDTSTDVQKVIDMAMHEPIFLEFADVCLETVRQDGNQQEYTDEIYDSS